jgi:hypothetical protein
MKSRPQIMEGIIAVMILGWIFVSMFVGVHASDNGKTMLWGVATFCFGIFALLAYAISLASD